MAEDKRAYGMNHGDRPANTAGEANPPLPCDDHTETGAPTAGPRQRQNGGSRVIVTPEGMIEEDEWSAAGVRGEPEEERPLEELVASVLAGPAVEVHEEPDPSSYPAAGDVELPNEAPPDDSEVAELDGEAPRRPWRVVAVLGTATFVVAAGAFLLTRGGETDSAPDQVAAQPRNVSANPPGGAGAPPAENPATAQPEPAPVAAPIVTPAPTPPAPAVTATPAPTAAPAPEPASATIAATPPPPKPAPIHVGDLDASTPGQRAAVKIYAHDASHNRVPGVTITGQWSGAYSGIASCVTDTTGSCSVRTPNLSGSGSVTFTIAALSKDGTVYAGSANHDPDGDSSGTSITTAV